MLLIAHGLGLLRRWVLRQHALGQAQDATEAARWRWAGLALGAIVPLLFIYQAKLNLHFPLNRYTRPLARFFDIPETFEHRFRQDYYDSMGYTQLGHLPTAADTRAGWQIRDWVRASSADGPAWSEEAMFTIWADQDIVVTNPTQLYNLWNMSKLDVSNMEAMIYQRHFGLVIFRAQFYPLPVLDAIGQNYDVVEHIEMNGFFYAILRPRPREGG